MVTLEDVALAAGVGKSTVSRVLNNRDTLVPVGVATRQRVLAAARDLNYRPNLFARGLKTKQSRIIGLAVRDFANPLWGALLDGIVGVTNARGYHAILHNMANEREEEQTVEMLVGQVDVDGVLIVGDFPGDQGTVQRLLERCPVAVALCRSLDTTIGPSINVDDLGGLRSIMEHLHEMGHRRIGFIGLAQPRGFADRYAGYRGFMDRHGLPVTDHLVDLSESKEQRFPSEERLVELGHAALRRIFHSGQPIEALVCACDPMALGALTAARGLGLVVPDDLSIVGFDDAPLARYCSPALTTVRHPVADMGRAAADLVIDLVEELITPPTDPILFTPELIVRESTARLRR